MPRRPAAAESAVAATVGDDPVEVAEAQRMMDLIFREKKPSGDLLSMARAQVLEEIVNRRLVLAYARRTGDAPSAAELAKAKKELQTSPGRAGPQGLRRAQGRVDLGSRSRAASPLAARVG